MITFQKFQQFATLVPPLRLRVEVPKATSVTSGITKRFIFFFRVVGDGDDMVALMLIYLLVK